MSNTRDPKAGFQKLLDWAMDPESDDAIMDRLLAAPQSRLQAFTLVAAQTNMARIGQLYAKITEVEDALFDRINELTPQQLINLRGYIERELGTNIDKMLPRSEAGQTSPVQILNYVQGAVGGGHSAPSGVLGPESREKVRQYLKGVLTEAKSSNDRLQPAVRGPHDLKVVGGDKK